MAFEDPITIDTTGTEEEILPVSATVYLDKIKSISNGNTNGSVYRSRLDSNTTLTISHQEGRKRRSLLRFDWKKVFDPTEDPIPAAQFPGGAQCAAYLVVETPEGYSSERIEEGIQQLFSWISGSQTTRDQFSRGES